MGEPRACRSWRPAAARPAPLRNESGQSPQVEAAQAETKRLSTLSSPWSFTLRSPASGLSQPKTRPVLVRQAVQPRIRIGPGGVRIAGARPSPGQPSLLGTGSGFTDSNDYFLLQYGYVPECGSQIVEPTQPVTDHVGSAVAAVASAGAGVLARIAGQASAEPAQRIATTQSMTRVGDRWYVPHALDRMQERGIVASGVENTIRSGLPSPGTSPGTRQYHDGVKNVSK